MYSTFPRLHLTIDLTIAPGFHVYGEPIPRGYVPLSVDVAPIDGLELRPMRWPSPRPFRVEGLDETFKVYEGTIRGVLPFAFTAAPGAGDQVLRTTLRYQACRASMCLPPAEIRVGLPVREVALVGRSLPPKTATV
jgi:DsbC/DsbD-like thiol-disulfide interchange protein